MHKLQFTDKDYKKYEIEDGLYLECSHVDKDDNTSFFYAEIEFENEGDAKDWEPLEFLGEEVTYDPEYKMVNYWKITKGK
jgi:CYTH domain-containing protein